MLNKKTHFLVRDLIISLPDSSQGVSCLADNASLSGRGLVLADKPPSGIYGVSGIKLSD